MLTSSDRPSLPALLAAACLATVLFAQPATARACGPCPKGTYKLGSWCLDSSFKCGPLYDETSTECVKKTVNTAKPAHVLCKPGDDLISGRCFAPCGAGYHACRGSCVSDDDASDSTVRQPTAPLRRFCDKGYWMKYGVCRTGCPTGYEWAHPSCRTAGCPDGTVDFGRACRKLRTLCPLQE